MLPASRLRRLGENPFGSLLALVLLLCLMVFTTQTYGNDPRGTLVVSVLEYGTDRGLPAFLVMQGPESLARQMSSLGVETVRLLPGTYAITVSLSGFGTQKDNRMVKTGVTGEIRFRLSRTLVQNPPPPTPAPALGSVNGRVTDAQTRLGIAGATVSIGSIWSGSTDASGSYQSSQLAPGAYPVVVSGNGYQSLHQSVNINPGQAASANFALEPSISSGQGCLWSDPKTWGGNIPGASTNVIIPTPTCNTVTLDSDGNARSITVNAAGTLRASTTRDSSLTLWAGNFIVDGTADWRTLRKAIVRWTGIDESRFVGGSTHMPLDTDPGLWVQHSGRLLIEGRPKLAWTRLEGTAARGSNHIVLAEDPAGWEIGDELAIAPTLPPTVAEHYDAYDYPKVAAIAGRDVTLDRSLNFDHPAVGVHPNKTMTAEVLNLSRNIVFTGEPGKRAHIMFNMTQAPQTLKYFVVRHMGPQRRPDDKGNVAVVLGRYGIHFHLMGDASRGTLVEGAVLRDIGNRAFVPHGSNGTTAKYVIVHDGYETGFWWDESSLQQQPNASHDTLWDHCVASRITFVQPFRGFRNAGFELPGGLRNALVDSVGIGVQGSEDAAAVRWLEGQSSFDKTRPDLVGWGVWGVRGFVAHNNRVDGWFIWQNTGNVHEVGFGSVIYYNGGVGIEHGAYLNAYAYRDIILYGNRIAGVRLRAVSHPKTSSPLTFDRMYIDQAGMSEFAVINAHHVGVTVVPTLFSNSTFRGYRTAALGVLTALRGSHDWIDLVNNTYSGVEVWVADDAHAEVQVRLQLPDRRAFVLRRRDQAGEYFAPTWNARVTPIVSFR